jgi:hypothetical protein
MYTTTIIHIEEQEQITYNRWATTFSGVENFKCVPKYFALGKWMAVSPCVTHKGKTRAMINHTQLNTTIPIFIVADFSVPKLIRQETSVCFRNKLLQQTGHFFSSSVVTGSAWWQFHCYKTVTLQWYQMSNNDWLRNKIVVIAIIGYLIFNS